MRDGGEQLTGNRDRTFLDRILHRHVEKLQHTVETDTHDVEKIVPKAGSRYCRARRASTQPATRSHGSGSARATSMAV